MYNIKHKLQMCISAVSVGRNVLIQVCKCPVTFLVKTDFISMNFSVTLFPSTSETIHLEAEFVVVFCRVDRVHSFD